MRKTISLILLGLVCSVGMSWGDETIYSWESSGTPVETGGTATYQHGDETNRVNYQNSGYYTLCLNGKKANINDAEASANAGYINIALNKALAEGDEIQITAYLNKNESKEVSAWIVYSNGQTIESDKYGDAANIHTNFSGSPQKKTIEVSAAAAGSTSFKMTRGNSVGTNLFITKLEIIRAEVPTHSVSAVTSTGTTTYGTVSAASSSVGEGKTTTITATPAEGYKVTNWAVSGTGASISPSGESNSLTTTLTMGTADATVTVTFGAKTSYTVSNTLTNVTKTSGATSTYELTEYTAEFAADDGYVLPADIEVTAGGSDITGSCTWTKATGTLTIPAASVTGNIAISITGVEYVPRSNVEVVFKSSTKDDSDNALADLANGNTRLIGDGFAKLIAANSVTLNAAANKSGYRCDGSRLYIVFKLDEPMDLTIKHNTNSTGDRYMRLYSFSSNKALSEITSSDWSTKTQKAFSSYVTSNTWESGQASAITPNSDKTTWNYTTKGCLTVTWKNLPAGYYVMDGTGSEAYIYSFTATPIPTSVSGSISAAGWSTFSSSYPLDLNSISFSEGEGAAYVASGASGNTVTLTKSTAKVASGEGLMINGADGATFTINTTADAATLTGDNYLVGVPTATSVVASTDGAYHYVFGYDKTDATVYGFYNLVSATNVPAGKAYLETASALETGGPNAPAVIRILDEENNATSFERIDGKNDAIKFFENGQLYILREGVVYDALGRKIR